MSTTPIGWVERNVDTAQAGGHDKPSAVSSSYPLEPLTADEWRAAVFSTVEEWR
jgi:hypothetical protein